MTRFFKLRSICLSFALAFPWSECEAEEGERAVEVEYSPLEWSELAQSIGKKYEKGQTKASHDLKRKQLSAELHSKLGGTIVSFNTEIRDVEWRNGVAKLHTAGEMPSPKSPTKDQPIKLTRFWAFEVLMDELTATSIVPGDIFSFKGKLDFNAAALPFGSTKGQQMYTVGHSAFVGTLGTMSSSSYACAIKGKRFKGKWAASE